MQNSNLIQLLILVILFGISGLGWILRQFQEQKQRKVAQRDQQRRFEEMLRTGRDPNAAGEPISPAGQAQLEELARRRQAQMEQIRRDHHSRQEAERSSRGEQAIPPIILMGPSGPIALPRESVQGGRGPTQKQQRQRGSSGQRSGRSGQQRTRRSDQPRQEPVATPEPIVVPPPTRAGGAKGPSVRGGGRPAITLPPATPRSVDDYRKLIAMMELFGPPVSERKSGPDPTPRLF